MPGVNLPAGDYLLQYLVDLQCRLTDLETTTRLQTAVGTTVGTTTSYSATTYGTAANSPACSVMVGSSGLVLVTYSALITPGINASNSESATAGLSIDGASPSASYASATGQAPVNNGLGGTQTVQNLVSGLTPGLHTFGIQYRVSTAAIVATFANQTLVAQPL